MKFNRLSAIFAGLVLIVSSCGKPNPEDGKDDKVTLSVSPTELTFESEVSSQAIEIKSNGEWFLDVPTSDSWCQTSVTSGKGDKSVTVTVSQNPSEKRTATITISAQGASNQTVKVTQNAVISTDLDVDPDKWDGTKRAAISYQLLTYSFSDSDKDGMGDFKGIEEKLDYLDELGVSAIWLSPAHPAGSYHGYDVEDYESLNPKYGTESDFQSLIDAAHSHGIKIYMDWVINHTSVNHPWFKDAISDENSAKRDWYVLSYDPASDIAAGKIPQIATEGAGGYDSGQWYSTTTGDASSMNIKFTLRWGTTPTLTAEQVETVSNTGSTGSGKYLYWGDGSIQEFYKTDDANVYTLSVDMKTSWGVLVRTSKTSWDNGTKWGAPSSAHQLEWGKALKLSNSDAQNILLPGMKSLFYHSHFWTGSFADLNYGSADKCAESGAFKAIVKSAQKWIDMGVDGFRLDGAKHLYHNATSDENPTFWNTFYTTVNDYYRQSHSGDFYMVGEVYDDYQAAAPYYKGFPAIFEFAFWYRLEYALNHTTGRYFAKDIISYQDVYKKYRADYHEATKLSNHDENRTGSTLGGSTDMMKMAGAVLLTSGGEPYIYYGEELGYVGVKDNVGDEYVRNPMKWGDSHTTSFIKQNHADMSKVKTVADQENDENSVLAVYRKFAQLRNTYPALATGKMSKHPVYNEDNDSYNSLAAWYMTEGSQKMLVLHNFSSSAVALSPSDDVDKAVATMGTVTANITNGKLSVRLGAWSSAVLLLK